MVFPFGKRAPREEQAPMGPPQPNYVPTDLVQRFASQGMSEPEIIARLRDRGFTPPQINDALRTALKSQVTGPQPMERPPMRSMGPEPMGMAPSPEFAQQRPQQMMMPERTQPMQEMQAPPQQEVPRFRPPERVVSQQMAPQRRFNEAPAPEQMFTYERGGEAEDVPEESGEITLEEVVEGIVSDKWSEFEERLGMFEKRDVQLQGQIEDLRKKVSLVEKSLQEREGTYVGKLDEFGDSMDNIEGRIGSIEKIFKEFIPGITQNIRTMSELVEKSKEKEEK